MAVRRWIGAVDDPWIMYSDRPADYTLGPPIGFGASSVVHLATFRPPATHSHSSRPASPFSHSASSPPAPIECAVKVINLDLLSPSTLALLTRETRLMSLSKHPNVLRVRGSWVEGSKLYIAMRLMRKGSVGDLMRYAHPGGMEEEVCKCILRQALEGLNYLHINGFIHRDLKSANLLIDDDGTVLLGDLGVAASLHDPATAAASMQVGRRSSFVGTPSWMAPEVVSQKPYNSSADMWSFGILALEMTRGRAPGSRDPPGTIFIKTLQNAPPTLDRTAGPHKYSRAFKDTIDSCLQKDPARRPTAAQLLAGPFFKSAKRKAFLIARGGVLERLPPLESRLERRRRLSIPPSINTHTSWDFSQPFPIATGSPRKAQSPLRRHSFDASASPERTTWSFRGGGDGEEEEEESALDDGDADGEGERTPRAEEADEKETRPPDPQGLGLRPPGLLGKFRRRLSSSGSKDKERPSLGAFLQRVGSKRSDSGRL